MKTINIRLQILPLYLIVVLLLQLELTVLNILLTCIPLLIISISIYLKDKKLGILGIFLFYTVALSQVVIPNTEDFLFIFLELVALLLPSIILLNIILQLENQEIFYLSKKKKPLLIAASLLIVILVVFYILAVLPWEGILFSPESIEGQIFLLIAVSLVCCTPFILAKN